MVKTLLILSKNNEFINIYIYQYIYINEYEYEKLIDFEFVKLLYLKVFKYYTELHFWEMIE